MKKEYVVNNLEELLTVLVGFAFSNVEKELIVSKKFNKIRVTKDNSENGFKIERFDILDLDYSKVNTDIESHVDLIAEISKLLKI
ncbi:MAG: hypothetical protein ACRC92_27035 [Peptostreptococcaceae bacterium]